MRSLSIIPLCLTATLLAFYAHASEPQLTVSVKIEGKNEPLRALIDGFSIYLVDSNSDRLVPTLIFPKRRLKSTHLQNAVLIEAEFGDVSEGPYVVKCCSPGPMGFSWVCYSKKINLEKDKIHPAVTVRLPLNFVPIKLQPSGPLAPWGKPDSGQRLSLIFYNTHEEKGTERKLDMDVPVPRRESRDSPIFLTALPMLSDGIYSAKLVVRREYSPGKRREESTVKTVEIKNGEMVKDVIVFDQRQDP